MAARRGCQTNIASSHKGYVDTTLIAGASVMSLIAVRGVRAATARRRSQPSAARISNPHGVIATDAPGFHLSNHDWRGVHRYDELWVLAVMKPVS